MGRAKTYVDSELTFAPKISDNSRKLALLKVYGKSEEDHAETVSKKTETVGLSGALPHFMKSTVSRRESVTSLGPLKKVPAIRKATKKSKIRKDGHAELPVFNNLSLKIAKEKGARIHAEIMAKAAAMPSQGTGRSVEESETFTFKPKVSSRSVSIAENLGTDFMARQQQHLDKQKKFLDQGISNHRTINPYTGRLSPVVVGNSGNSKLLKKTTPKPSKEGPSGNVAWSTPNSTKILTAANTNSEEGRVPKITRSGTSLSPIKHPSKSQSSIGLAKSLNDSPYHHATNASFVLRKQNTRAALKKPGTDSDTDDDDDIGPRLSRSKTMPPFSNRRLSKKLSVLNLERLKNAKSTAEKAMKHRKVFTIQGSYSSVRKSLRRRGWVEKFYKPSAPVPKRTPRVSKSKNKGLNNDSDNDDDDDDDDVDVDDDPALDLLKNDENTVPPWEEDGGIYGIMSRMVRNSTPTFIWCIRRDTVDYRFLHKDQMVNHFCKAGSFTTKVGLCVNLRNVSWYENVHADSFFPRCYKLSMDEEKECFKDDFRLTACQSLVRHVVERYSDLPEIDSTAEGEEAKQEEVVKKEKSKGGKEKKEGKEKTKEAKEKEEEEKEGPAPPSTPASSTDTDKSRPESRISNPCTCSSNSTDSEKVSPEMEKTAQTLSELEDAATTCLFNQTSRPKKQRGIQVPLWILEQAIQQCQRWLDCQAHLDIDRWDDPYLLSDSSWDQLIQAYYKIVHDGAIITNAASLVQECQAIANRMKQLNPQFEMDGIRNVWIVKPGAKSRGRGIMVYDNLEDMLKLVSSSVVKKEGKYIVQKYIERPLLLYNTKFDIRQWFLVTDWNPLTIWFYKECYLRFCSQQFTLDNFNEAIHLSNFSVQKHYANGPRSSKLPKDNMWDDETFKQFLSGRGQGQAWADKIYPGMKRAVICALLATQDVVEYRKSSFELYGADFMLTTDLNPWLIEINSSPTMAQSTPITTRLCTSVIEDTMKVVIDRKYDRNCDTGGFELSYKQNPVTVPPYMGINLCVEGQGIRKPFNFSQNINPKAALEESPYLQKPALVKSFTTTKLERSPASAPAQSQNSQSTPPVKYAMTHSRTPPNNSSLVKESSSGGSGSGKDNGGSSGKKRKDSSSSPAGGATKQDSVKSKSDSKQESKDAKETSPKESSSKDSITSSTEKKTRSVSLDHKVLLTEREKLPMRMTHVTATDFRPVKMGNKGNGIYKLDNEKNDQMPSKCFKATFNRSKTQDPICATTFVIRKPLPLRRGVPRKRAEPEESKSKSAPVSDPRPRFPQVPYVGCPIPPPRKEPAESPKLRYFKSKHPFQAYHRNVRIPVPNN